MSNLFDFFWLQLRLLWSLPSAGILPQIQAAPLERPSRWLNICLLVIKIRSSASHAKSSSSWLIRLRSSLFINWSGFCLLWLNRTRRTTTYIPIRRLSSPLVLLSPPILLSPLLHRLPWSIGSAKPLSRLLSMSATMMSSLLPIRSTMAGVHLSLAVS